MKRELLEEVNKMRSLFNRMSIVENVGSMPQDDNIPMNDENSQDELDRKRAEELLKTHDIDWEREEDEWDGGYAPAWYSGSIEDEDGTIYYYTADGIHLAGGEDDIDSVEFDHAEHPTQTI